MIPIPIKPEWPDKKSYDKPVVKGLPLVCPDDPFWKQTWHWLIRRPRYIVTRDYYTYCPLLNAWIFIPRNFVYDFASIPRVPFGLFLRPDGILAYGAGPHDFGSFFGGLMLSAGPEFEYRFTELSDPTIDDVFGDLNEKASGLSFITGPAQWAVSNFGEPRKVDITEANWSQPTGRREWL